jgi:NADH/NAD ratio-sensing transcriptional regulator Rex
LHDFTSYGKLIVQLITGEKMENTPMIPDIVVGRLPLYLSGTTAHGARRAKITSSYELGERLGISAAQIGKDPVFLENLKTGTDTRIDYLVENSVQILIDDLGHGYGRCR